MPAEWREDGISKGTKNPVKAKVVTDSQTVSEDVPAVIKNHSNPILKPSPPCPPEEGGCPRRPLQPHQSDRNCPCTSPRKNRLDGFWFSKVFRETFRDLGDFGLFEKIGVEGAESACSERLITYVF